MALRVTQANQGTIRALPTSGGPGSLRLTQAVAQAIVKVINKRPRRFVYY